MSERVSAADAALMPQHIGIVIGVGGEDEGDDLRLAFEAFGEHRPDGAVDLATGEHFAFAHAAFALDEAAGEASASVGVFAVVNGEREKIDAFAGIGIGGGGGEDNVIAQANDGRALGLLGEFSGFERDLFAAGECNGDYRLLLVS